MGRPLVRVVLCFGLLALGACGGGGVSGGGPGAGPAATPSPLATPAPPGSEETVVIGGAGLCSAGDVSRLDIGTSSENRFALINDEVVCTPAKDNRQEEYTLILYNTTGSAATFEIDSTILEVPPTTGLTKRERPQLLPPKTTRTLKAPGVNITDQTATYLHQTQPKRPYGKGKYMTQTGGVYGLIQGDEVEFRVRCSPDNADTFCTTSAILRAQGDHINIFVDRDVPFGFPSNPDSLLQTQLDETVLVYENNIYPLINTLAGSSSDVDGDGRVSVLITPIVNRNLIVDLGPVRSYTDSRNLLPFDPVTNFGSNEQEVIFVFAPDSEGNYGSPDGSTGIDSNDFLPELKGWIAFQYYKLVNYNQHILINGGNAEDDWISDGIGAVMADLAGFNIWRDECQRFLSRPEFTDIRGADDLDVESSSEYLFMLYYIQSQVDDTAEDTNADGYDDDLAIIANLTTSELTSIENLEEQVDFSFDDTRETEFQAMFKDWTIALVTSGSGSVALQQSQDVVNYFFNVNPTVYGSGVLNASGSVRYGAVGNRIGIDLHAYDPGDGIHGVLLENVDELTWSPGNIFYGYVQSYAAMYVRLSGLFQAKQTVVVRTSKNTIQGFIVRRTDVSYPVTYAESIFGSIDQHAELLDDSTAAGSANSASPNPYWGTRGIQKRLDYRQSVLDSNLNDIGRPLTIVGRIDLADNVQVCPDNLTDCDFPNTAVPDTDKYEIVIPDLGRGDEDDVAVTVRRQFENGSDSSGLSVMLAVVSSKDVPYPYLPHPTRGNTVRPDYRWMTSSMTCGAGDAAELTDTGATCGSGDYPGASRLSYLGLTENTGTLGVSGGEWDGDISGFECDAIPVTEIGRATTPATLTTVETSPSPLGFYSWLDFVSESTYPTRFPDVLFAREVIKPSPGYPSSATESIYDPRAINGLTANCFKADPDDVTPESPDDVLMPGEMSQPTSLATQVLVEMSRDRTGDPGVGIYAAPDLFATDRDSRDSDVVCARSDIGNNMNTATMNSGEGSLLIGNRNANIPHIANRLSASKIPYINPLLPNQMCPNPSPVGCDRNQILYSDNPDAAVVLRAGKSYTLIVGGTGGSTGNYELKIRKVNLSRARVLHEAINASARNCTNPDDA